MEEEIEVKGEAKGMLSQKRSKTGKNAFLLQYVSSRLRESSKFWKTCLKVARAHPELCAEEVEYKAIMVTLGLSPFSY